MGQPRRSGFLLTRQVWRLKMLPLTSKDLPSPPIGRTPLNIDSVEVAAYCRAGIGKQ